MTDKLGEDYESIAIERLKSIRKKIDEIGDPAYTVPDLGNQEEPEKGERICIACQSSIKPTEICVTMPCCGCLFHASCIAKICNAHRFLMNKICPKCTTPLDQDFEARLIQIYDIIKKNE
ncbi:hypothetical protein TVAG_411420 [Trichomonas vaginalis G3]|uniref:RING-type domain-containing protein n=1 Tax=Trichomonas vaginalis (strain ATCC PRA-98 / G3) TaxID=412133 RepID=A2DXP7_TRIV3|nr:zinc finger, RING/FYVE/PHD-type domain-containing protein [Trichomonas vaginalis G3]EAY14876.1 hypothetical protein TVAG_411420 [Trichomonas vaginalis G3]KAI5541143.1 zinc finger, RING/FYVE/PHD-type domain-containing protein [Trichomonas vaginalis G3]|eukprot:XP_001327099.1 hypothetical protein [Trichomonas vaginalis G3]